MVSGRYRCAVRCGEPIAGICGGLVHGHVSSWRQSPAWTRPASSPACAS